MRINNIIVGVAMLAGIVAATPHQLSVEDICIPSTTTVFPTPSAIYVTVTVCNAPQSTVYITVPSISYVRFSKAPTTTITAVVTSTHTSTVPNVEVLTNGGGKHATLNTVYDTTVTETHMITVTAGLSEKPKSVVEGPISFIVVDGTTSFLGGKTPDPDEPTVYASSAVAVTLVPVPASGERTTTLKSTVHLTSEVTVTSTLPPFTIPDVTRTGSLLTAVPSGGWNTSNVGAHINLPTGTIGTAPTTSSKPTLVTNEPTFDLYPTTTRSPVGIPTYSAQSGFKYTTLSGPIVTSASIGGSTTAIVGSDTYSWVLPASSTSPSYASPPYGNSTHSSSKTSSSLSVSAFAALAFSDAINATSSSTVPTASVRPVDPSSFPTSKSTMSATISSSQTSNTVQSTISSSPTCGIIGDFTLDFDNIPPLSIGNQSIDTVQPMPIFNPYKKFMFSEGFVVVPPPRVPYLPSSKPLLLEFIPNFTVNHTDEKSGPNSRENGWAGDLGNGDHGATGCFSYNFHGASFGCDSKGPDCLFTISGFRYDRATKLTNQVTTQTITVAACPGLENCPLTPITVDSTFHNLDLVRMNVTVSGLPKIWWVDDVRLGWFDNSCEKGICRQNTRIR